MKRTPLQRKTRLRAKRPTPRTHKFRVRLTGLDMEALREHVYYRDRGRCQWEGCGVVLPLYGSVFTRAHLAHKTSRGAGGDDTPENTRILCFTHHIEFEHHGKPEGAA